MGCVLREVNVLNKENEIDVPVLRKSTRLKESLAKSTLLMSNSLPSVALRENRGCARTKIPRTRLSPTLDLSKLYWMKPSLLSTSSFPLFYKCCKERNPSTLEKHTMDKFI